uniref:Ribonuclease A-domain domain-containing protein n=1 Tax=Chelydra serpentina TaxID=8475 RepID=A0A8C3S4I5_CHESE
ISPPHVVSIYLSLLSPLQFDPMMDMVLASGHSCCPKFKKFLWQHWDYPKTCVYPYCDVMMSKKGLFGKLKHTFIHAPIKMIINICHGEGIYLGNGWFKSKRLFYITRCTFNCKTGHYTGACMVMRIIVKCKCGFPVAIKE